MARETPVSDSNSTTKIESDDDHNDDSDNNDDEDDDNDEEGNKASISRSSTTSEPSSRPLDVETHEPPEKGILRIASTEPIELETPIQIKKEVVVIDISDDSEGVSDLGNNLGPIDLEDDDAVASYVSSSRKRPTMSFGGE